MILDVTEEYVDQLISIDSSSGGYPWGTRNINKVCNQKNWGAYLFLFENLPAGFIVFQRILDEASILHLAVHKGFQQRGVAKKLLHYFIEECGKRSIASVFLEVRESNLNAIKLYASFGFQEIGIRRNYYPTSEGFENGLDMAMYVN